MDTPAAINRQAWTWLHSFLDDLADDMRNRVPQHSGEPRWYS